MDRRLEVERELKRLRLRIRRNRTQLKKDKARRDQLELMLTTGDFSEVRVAHFPNRGTKLRRVLRVMARAPEDDWTVRDLLPHLGHPAGAGRHAQGLVRKYLQQLRKDAWIVRISAGRYRVTEAALARLPADSGGSSG